VPAELRLPQLGDEALILRGFVDNDVALVQTASGDPLIPLITTVPRDADLMAALAFIQRQRSRMLEGSGYSFAIADAASDEALGQIGVWPLNHGRASVGYWVARQHRGRGVGGHALAMVSKWALTLPDLHRLELYIEPWNEASWRAAERCGYEREGLLRQWQDVGGQRRDMFLYSLLRAHDS
jgi:[ribosomal protein S5]-alanine N-acetyltransferase